MVRGNPLALGRRRLATLADASSILELVNESMSKNFRIRDIFDINNIIESSTFAIVQLSEKNVIVGFLAAKGHPLIPSIHPSAWERYIWTKYKTVEMTARNTLFIHLLCWNKNYAGREIVDSLLRSLFMHDSYLIYVAVMKSLPKYTLLMPGQSRCEGSFKRVSAAERGVPPDRLPTLFVAERADVCPRLRVRRAVEEDNDDLVPIIEQHSTRLREMYGEFYISELISRHPESERVLLVGERNELAVGVMILNTVINYEALEDSFDLSPFAGLRHLETKPVHGVQFAAKVSSEMLLETAAEKGDVLRKRTPSSTTHSAVNLVSHADKLDTGIKKTLSWHADGESVEKFMGEELGDMMSLGDDDEIDFDIVNIHHDLLKVPRPLSVELNIEFLLTEETLQISGKDVMATIQETVDSSQSKLKKAGPVTSDRNTSLSNQLDVVHYSGTPNAFLLEVFAMHPDYDERYGYDILQTAFEIFPDRDYCVLCLPSNQPVFPLLEHFTLVAPKHTREKYTNQSLYVTHVNSVRENVAVRLAEAYDIPAMSHILENMTDRQTILRLLEKSIVSESLNAYALLSQNQPVGVVILGSLDNCVEVRSQYDLEPEPRSADTDGAIIAGILSPALEPHARWYLRDVLRHSKFFHLFWPCHASATGKDGLSSRNIMSLASRMVPVMPHGRSIPNVTGIKALDKVWIAPTSYTLWGIETHLTALPKVDVNNGIVVVGASRTGLAFIEKLLMGPASHYLTFTNITLVSEHGLPLLADCMPAAEICLPRGGRYTDRYLKSIPINYYVDCINGVMVGIDRKKKCIRLKKGGVKYYDVLVLTCGKQFQHPDYLAESFEHSKKMSKGKPCVRMLMDNPKYQPAKVPPLPELPDNVFLINSLHEANINLRRLLSMINSARRDDRLSAENRVVVYGDCLESYTTMAALLEIGVTPNEIAFVEPFPSTERNAMRVNCFNDEIIDERVQATINELGIYVYRQCHFVSWRVKGSSIWGLDVMSPLHSIFIPCFALFYYGLKALNYHAFKAISECGLVYDGGLVVDPTFKTNDPNVYGAGPCVQYSRRLRAERKLHRYSCPENVGEALANIFLNHMDPFVMGDQESNLLDLTPRYRSSLLDRVPHPSIETLLRPSLEKNRKWEPVMEFESPVICWGTLPGTLYYMRLRAPGEDIPMEVKLASPHQGHSLITNKDGNYFQLRLNEFHCVDAITCLSKKLPPYELFSGIYGIHESLFNKLLQRYVLNKIDDFYEYFQQRWMSAMYQESFGHLLRHICRQNVGTVYDLVKSHFTLDDLMHDNNDDVNFGENLEGLDKDSKSASGSPNPSCYSYSECAFGPLDAPNLGSVHSVIERFLKGGMVADRMDHDVPRHFPSECGQSEVLRNEAKAFWSALSGDRIVTAHLARFLDRNFLPNPHYAPIKPNLI